MPTPDARSVTADDGTLLHASVSRGDDATTTIVMAHGWALSSRSWDPVRHALRLLGPVGSIAYDQRHHGASERGDTPLSIDLLGADLARVLDQLAPEGPVILAGHSMGGMAIMALAAAAPGMFADRVAGVALVATSAGHLRPRVDPAPLLAALARHGAGSDRLRRLGPPALPLHQHLVRRLLFGAAAAPEVVLATAQEIQEAPARTIGEFWPVLCAHDKAAALTRLSSVPVEVFVGDRDRLTPVRHAEFLANHIAGANLTVLPGQGHMLTAERPELLARSLLRLAQRSGQTSEVNCAESTA